MKVKVVTLHSSNYYFTVKSVFCRWILSWMGRLHPEAWCSQAEGLVLHGPEADAGGCGEAGCLQADCGWRGGGAMA